MSQHNPLVLTISRQLGCGAAVIGQQLAKRLGMLYLDREILQRAAQQLQVSEELVQAQDETVTTFWQSLIQSFANGSPEIMYTPSPLYLPTDHELFQVEARVITQVAHTQPAVIVGRGGVHVLREHPRQMSLFLYASSDYRLHRVQSIYQLPRKEAQAAIEASDHARTRYHRIVAGKEWNDARQYHLCLDTGILGATATVDAILSYVSARFGFVHALYDDRCVSS